MHAMRKRGYRAHAIGWALNHHFMCQQQCWELKCDCTDTVYMFSRYSHLHVWIYIRVGNLSAKCDCLICSKDKHMEGVVWALKGDRGWAHVGDLKALAASLFWQPATTSSLGNVTGELKGGQKRVTILVGRETVFFLASLGAVMQLKRGGAALGIANHFNSLNAED